MLRTMHVLALLLVLPLLVGASYLNTTGTYDSSASFPGAAQYVRQATKVLNASQIKAAHGTEYTFVAAPGSGLVIVPLALHVVYTFGTVAYADASGDADFVLRYGSISGVQAPWTAPDLTATVDTSAYTVGGGAPQGNLSQFADQALILVNPDADFTLGDGTLTYTMAYVLVNASTGAIVPLYPTDASLTGSGTATDMVIWIDAHTLGSTPKGAGAEQTISFQPGLLSTIVNTKGVYGKFVKDSTLDNLVASAITFTTCTVNPVMTLYNCSTDASCASPTTMASATITASGQAFTGTISSAAIAAGDYLAWAISAGSCVALDGAATAQIHAN